MKKIASVVMIVLLCGCITTLREARAADDDSGLDALVALLAQTDDAGFQLDLLKGIRDGLKGRRNVTTPKGWDAAYAKLSKSPNKEVRELAKVLALTFGDKRAVESLKQTVADKEASPKERADALQTLVEKNTPDLAPLLHTLLSDQAIRGPVVRALAYYDHPATPAMLLKQYSKMSGSEKDDALNTLAARKEYAGALLDAMATGAIDRQDVSAFVARKIHSFGDEDLSARLKKHWGTIRQTSAENKAEITRYKKLLTDKFVSQGDARHGRLVYSRTCMQCHRLYNIGGMIGPDLTGSNRANLDYVLENVLSPSAVIGRDYRLKNIITASGRVIAGIIVEETDSSYTVQTANEKIVLSKEDIDEMIDSKISMMPEGLWKKLSKEDVRDLVLYLRTKKQVPYPDDVKPEDLK